MAHFKGNTGSQRNMTHVHCYMYSTGNKKQDFFVSAQMSSFTSSSDVSALRFPNLTCDVEGEVYV